MSRRIVRLPDRGDTDGARALAPVPVVTPLDEMRTLASALEALNPDATAAVLDSGRRRLQQAIVDELHRLVGELVTEVSLAATTRERIGRAIAFGTTFMDSRPPDHILAQCSDPEAVVDRCAAACSAIVRYLGAELAATRRRSEQAPLPDPESWVRDAIDDLRDALALAQEDGVDRRATLRVQLQRTFELADA